MKTDPAADGGREQVSDAETAWFSRHGRLEHLVFTQQFRLDLLESLFQTADRARNLSSTRIGADYLRHCLPNKRTLLYFVQPSTRTLLSFQAAASILGMSCSVVSSTQTSSELKGETPFDSVHTFAMYHDMIVIRYPEARFAETCAAAFTEQGLQKHIINGGSGMDQHPTQALLDIYTLDREFRRRGGIWGKRLMIVGDLARGRAARSLIYLLGKFEGVRIDLVSPRTMQLKPDLKEYMTHHGIDFRESTSMEPFLAEADAIYMTRVQNEYTDSEIPSADAPYVLSLTMYAKLRSDCAVLHPLPRREEIPTSADVDPRSRYWEQVENGMWARVALLAHMFDCDSMIRAA